MQNVGEAQDILSAPESALPKDVVIQRLPVHLAPGPSWDDMQKRVPLQETPARSPGRVTTADGSSVSLWPLRFPSG
jgi:hypothetical protein